MSTPTERSLAVDRLAKRASADAMPNTDYLFAALPSEIPDRDSGETDADYHARVAASITWGITLWDAQKLGPQPTGAEIEAEVNNPLAIVPASISMAQLRETLIRHDMLAGVNAAIADISDTTERAVYEAWFEYQTDVRRNNAKVIAIAAAMGLTDAQVDALFIEAATYQ